MHNEVLHVDLMYNIRFHRSLSIFLEKKLQMIHAQQRAQPCNLLSTLGCYSF
ncbi:unnamed protein product, partial [Vitis vinifera]